jgi:hypothetical protein
MKYKPIEKIASYNLLVVRQRPDGSLGCSRPCAECGKWIYCAKILGLSIKVFHIDEKDEIVPHDGRCCRYKANETIW